MSLCKTYSLILLLVVFSLSGCYNTPVRHLAADVAMITEGKSTREDVLVFLGDPDEQVEQAGGVEKWLYKQEDKTTLEKTPVVGRYFGSPDYKQVVVVFRNGIVVDTLYSASDLDDMDWADDYSWQSKEE